MAKEDVVVRFESDGAPDANIQIHKLYGRETISKLFYFDLVIATTTPDKISAAELLGAGARLIFDREDVELRRMHGIISEVEDRLDTNVEYRTFRLRMVPRAHRLTLVQVQEIFLDTSVPDIIKDKLERCGLSEAVDFRLMGTYKSENAFVVQYKESDLAFVSRLAEHLGVSFFFEHGENIETIVFTDNKHSFASHKSPLPYQPKGEKCDIYQLEVKTRMIPKAHVVQDYNYENATFDLTFSDEAASGTGGGFVEFGTHHTDDVEGAKLAAVRAEEHEASFEVFSGESDICHLSAGVRFTLDGHPVIGDKKLLITEVEHRATQVVFGHGSDDTEQSYTNQWKAISSDKTYRPPRATQRPRIYGLVHGIVQHDPVKEPGKYALIDDAGRYMVRFLFDTADHPSGKVSCPIRMAQPHAGPHYGHHFPLKPGIEVLVAFIDGDPDRPVIVGSVPNNVTQSPVDKDNAIMNRIKTTSGVIIEMKDN